MKPQHSRNLDLLRAFAVMTVFCGHLFQTFVFHGNPIVGHIARFGVMAFFVHTALVLMQSMERLSDGGQRPSTARFYIRRIFRIYPLAIATTLAIFYFAIPSSPWLHFSRISPGTLASNLLLVQNLARRPSVLAPFWTLPYEVQMYAFLPLCFWLVFKLRVNAIWLWIAGILLYVPPVPFLRLIVQYFPCFLAGVWAYRRMRAGGFKPLPQSYWPVFLLGTCALYTALTTTVRWYVPAQSQSLPLIVLDWLCSLAIGIAIPYFAERTAGWLSRAASTLAEYSYGVYLSHMPVMWFVLVKMAGQPLAWRIAVLTAGAVAIPVLAYHLLEKPLIDLGKQLTGGGREKRAVAQQAAAA